MLIYLEHNEELKHSSNCTSADYQGGGKGQLRRTDACLMLPSLYPACMYVRNKGSGLKFFPEMLWFTKKRALKVCNPHSSLHKSEMALSHLIQHNILIDSHKLGFDKKSDGEKDICFEQSSFSPV